MQNKCLICNSINIRQESHICNAENIKKYLHTFNYSDFYDKELFFFICEDCGFISAPDNKYEYEKKDFLSSSKPSNKPGSRAGDGFNPGREYFMFKNAYEVIGKNRVDVLIFGAGLSKDHEKLRSLHLTSNVYITDFVNLQKSDWFIPLDSTNYRFDIVICCEVMEHFIDPQREFKKLFEFVKDNGILICSTNINNEKSLENVLYPYFKGHTSYYNASSISVLASQNNCYYDFRLPECSLGAVGLRKRYIFFFRDKELQKNISNFFAISSFAYSEPPVKTDSLNSKSKKYLKKLIHMIRHLARIIMRA